LGGLSAAAGLAAAKGAHALCVLTPAGPTGPFYPTAFDEADWDLTRVGGGGRAEGRMIEVAGRVLDAGCRPLAGAAVEVWQANAAGRYAHPRDGGNPRPLDAHFQGQARLLTGDDGSYRFLTIMPGAYPVSDDWWRPPHIHFRVAMPARDLITQMYFAGEALNEGDRIYGVLDAAERERVTIDFSSLRGDGVAAGRFDLVMA
jgi:protocatechuate 3,4-dioxygenase beta subunit